MTPKRIEFVDGSCAEIDANGHWDLTLPNGKHVRGIATDSVQAREYVERTHNDWALERWNKGSLAKGQLFVCSLK